MYHVLQSWASSQQGNRRLRNRCTERAWVDIGEQQGQCQGCLPKDEMGEAACQIKLVPPGPACSNLSNENGIRLR